MADIQNLTVSVVADSTVDAMKLATVQDGAPNCKTLNIPNIDIAFKITNSSNQQVIVDHTGVNTIHLPGAIGDLSRTEKRALLLLIKDFMIESAQRQAAGEEPLQVL